MKNIYKIILRDVFEISFIGFAALFLFEIYIDGFVSDYINLNYILGIIILLAVLSAYFQPQKQEGDKINFFKLFIQAVLFIIFITAIFLGLQSFSIWLAIIITLAAAAIYLIILKTIKV